MISVLCPSRSRPAIAKRMYDSAIKNPGCQIDIKFFLNHDDPQLNLYRSFLSPNQYIVGPNQSPVFSWNLMAQESKHDIMFLVGDDCVFESDLWGVKVVEAFDQYPDKIACVFPSLNDRRFPADSNPHFCLHKNWITALGYFIPPWFHLHYIDTWIAEITKSIGRFHRIKDFVMPVELIYDAVHNSYEKTWLMDRDRWIWNHTKRYRDHDIETLRSFIDNWSER